VEIRANLVAAQRRGLRGQRPKEKHVLLGVVAVFHTLVPRPFPRVAALLGPSGGINPRSNLQARRKVRLVNPGRGLFEVARHGFEQVNFGRAPPHVAVQVEVGVRVARAHPLLGLELAVTLPVGPRPHPVGTPHVRSASQIAHEPERRPEPANVPQTRQLSPYFDDSARETKLGVRQSVNRCAKAATMRATRGRQKEEDR